MGRRSLESVSKYAFSCYNEPYLGFIILAYLVGMGSKKLAKFIFWQTIAPSWWIILVAKVFLKDQSPFASISIYSFPSAQQSIYGSRRDIGVNGVTPALFQSSLSSTRSPL